MTAAADVATGITYLRTEPWPLANLKMYPGNAKQGRVEEIRASLRRSGQYRSLVVREHKVGRKTVYTILAGNHTFMALEAEGAVAARCEFIVCDDETARVINLADNRTAELGGYDLDALLEQLAAGPLDGTGWTDEDMARVQADAEEAAENALKALGGLPDEMDPERRRDEDNGTHTRMSAHRLRWQKAEVTMTAEERTELDAAYEEYLDLHGTDFGFVRALLNRTGQ